MRSGLGAQLGIAAEETYGTFKAPTRFLPFETESLAFTPNYVKSKGLKAGQMAQAQKLHRKTTGIVGGDLNLEFLDQGMGLIFDMLHGNAVVPAKVEGKEKTYVQTHEIGRSEPFGKSRAIQVGRPDTAGVTQPFSYLGCKFVTVTLSIEQGGMAMLAVTVAGRRETEAEALAEATYDADTVPFTFQEMALHIGGAPAANVRSVSIACTIPQPERFLLGNEGLTSEPIVNEYVDVTANATLEFAGLADHERFTKETVSELKLVAKGAEIEAGQFFGSEVILPAAKQTSSSPTVQGPDIITQQVAFEGLDNGVAAPLKVKLTSSDSAL